VVNRAPSNDWLASGTPSSLGCAEVLGKAVMRNAIALSIIAAGIFGCAERKSESQEAIDRAKAAPPTQNLRSDAMLPGETAVVAECDEIMTRLCRDGVEAAFEKIRSLSPLAPEELDKLETGTADQLAAIGPRFGKILGFEKVRTQKKSDSVMECVYLVKCERHILRWRFYFYRPQERWFLNSLTWDDNIKEL
jgi:hypothetical protein